MGLQQEDELNSLAHFPQALMHQAKVFDIENTHYGFQLWKKRVSFTQRHKIRLFMHLCVCNEVFFLFFIIFIFCPVVMANVINARKK